VRKDDGQRVFYLYLRSGNVVVSTDAGCPLGDEQARQVIRSIRQQPRRRRWPF
jgi:hypothetical protein